MVRTSVAAILPPHIGCSAEVSKTVALHASLNHELCGARNGVIYIGDYKGPCVCMGVCVYIYIYMYICACVRVRTCSYTHIYIIIYIYINAYM